MKMLVMGLLCLGLTSCAKVLPGFMDTLDDAVTDQAIEVNVNKAAMKDDTDVKINVDIINKTQPIYR